MRFKTRCNGVCLRRASAKNRYVELADGLTLPNVIRAVPPSQIQFRVNTISALGVMDNPILHLLFSAKHIWFYGMTPPGRLERNVSFPAVKSITIRQEQLVGYIPSMFPNLERIDLIIKTSSHNFTLRTTFNRWDLIKDAVLTALPDSELWFQLEHLESLDMSAKRLAGGFVGSVFADRFAIPSCKLERLAIAERGLFDLDLSTAHLTVRHLHVDISMDVWEIQRYVAGKKALWVRMFEEIQRFHLLKTLAIRFRVYWDTPDLLEMMDFDEELYREEKTKQILSQGKGMFQRVEVIAHSMHADKRNLLMEACAAVEFFRGSEVVLKLEKFEFGGFHGEDEFAMDYSTDFSKFKYFMDDDDNDAEFRYGRM